MNVAVWVISGLLAALYLMAGITKLVKPREELGREPRMAWTQDFTPGGLKAVGAVEVLGAVGLVLPWLTGIAPVLTPIAAVGLALVQVGAAIVHLRRGERATVPTNVVLIVLPALVAWYRFGQL